MNELNTKTLNFGIWCGLLYSLFAGLGWWAGAQFIPPHAPTMGAEEIAAIYREDFMRIRVGMILLMVSAMFYIPFTAAVAFCISRIEGCFGVLSISQVMGGVGNVFLTFYPAMWWLIASFRMDDPNVIRMFNDIGWLQIVGGLTPFLPVLGSVAIATLYDKSKNPIFPRWSAFLSLWTFVLLLPGQLIFFFKTGPFAWNGLLAFWVPLTVFGPWFIVMTFVMRGAMKRGAIEIK